MSYYVLDLFEFFFLILIFNYFAISSDFLPNMISIIVGIINNYKMVDQDKSLRNFKTIIVGKSSVGKSTILLRYI